MSDVATSWAKAQQCPSPLAKTVLIHMATYFDAAGEGWAAVRVIAFEMQRDERTVQRGIAALRKARLLIPTGDDKVYLGRIYPIYQMPIDQGPANTRVALRELTENERLQPASRGDSAVTPSGAGCHSCHPTGDTAVTPRGDSAVTHNREVNTSRENTQGASVQPPEISCFEQAEAAWIAKGAERVAPDLALKAWRKAAAVVGDVELLGAVLRYLAEAGEVQRGRLREFHRWLWDRRYKPWLGLAAAPMLPLEPPPIIGFPPELVAAVSARGNPATWLGLAEWRDTDRVVLAGPTSAKWLRTHISAELKKLGVKVMEKV